MSDLNFNPSLAEPVLESQFLTSPELVSGGAQPILDEQGNPLIDEKGRLIYGS